MIKYHFLGVLERPFYLVILRFPVGRSIWAAFFWLLFLAVKKSNSPSGETYLNHASKITSWPRGTLSCWASHVTPQGTISCCAIHLAPQGTISCCAIHLAPQGTFSCCAIHLAPQGTFSCCAIHLAKPRMINPRHKKRAIKWPF
jgi:hypothetical protein